MDRYLAPESTVSENPKSKPRRRAEWRRCAVELNGKLDSKYRHDLSSLLMQSYSEIGVFPHLYGINGRDCLTHFCSKMVRQFGSSTDPQMGGVSAIDFDNKGIYLASVTQKGCLTVHDFETLYCKRNESLVCTNEDESNHLLHVYLREQLDAVRWNQANQDEVVCISSRKDDVYIFDIGYISSKPVEVLKLKANLSVLGSKIRKGLWSIATTDNSRLIASDSHGVVNVWDRREGILPCLEFTTGSRTKINSLQPNVENQTILGAGKDGTIYVWDLRGGRVSAAFQCHNKEVYNPPLASLKLASMLGKVESLKAQSNIIPKEIHSIDLNPSCPYQLAFHLDDGWSGVLDIYNLKVTHVHCPPPPWLDGRNVSTNATLRKPSWLPTSMYAVGSTTENGIHILDFYPDSSSPCHVDFDEDMQNTSETQIHQIKQNRFVPLSESVTACATHPLNGSIIAGTKLYDLLLVSQKKYSESGDNMEDNEIKHEDTHKCI